MEPVVWGADSGLELRWWVVREGVAAAAATAGEDSPDGASTIPTIAGALAPYVDRPTPVPPALRQRWEANGLRVLAVPPEELDALRRALPLVGQVHRQWLGQVPQWLDVVNGPMQPDDVVAMLDTGPVTLEPGRVRLLSRCWIAPDDEGERAVLRLDLALQHVVATRWRANPELTAALALPPARTEEGLVFGRLVAELTCRGQEALVIVPERPGVVWAEAGGSESSGADGAGSAGDASPTAEVGPPLPRPPTIGELLLAGGALESPTVSSRAMVILIPHVPERFTLTGHGAPAGTAPND